MWQGGMEALFNVVYYNLLFFVVDKPVEVNVS